MADPEPQVPGAITTAQDGARRLRRGERCAINRAMSTGIDLFSRLMLLLAGVLGAGGVLAAAWASHAGDGRIAGAIALIALGHAPALLGFGLTSPNGRLLRAGALSIGAGACLFAGDLAARQALDGVIVPGLAPTGGAAIIAGWAAIAVAGLLARRPARRHVDQPRAGNP